MLNIGNIFYHSPVSQNKIKHKRKSDDPDCTEVKITSLERMPLSEWKVGGKNPKQKIAHKSSGNWP